MNVLGGAFAEFGFQDEAASGRDLLAGLQSVTNFHAIFVALAQRNRVRLEAVRRANENRRRVFDGLDRLDWNRDRNTTAVGANSDRHEKTGTPSSIGVGQGHAGCRGTRLLAQQAAHMGDLTHCSHP